MASKKKKLEKIDKEKIKVDKKEKEDKVEKAETKKKTKTSQSGNTKVHLKPNVRDLIIFIILATVLGLVFMNVYFTLALVLGILLIIGICLIFNKIKRRWIRVILNLFAILILLGSIAGVAGTIWFINYIRENAPEFTEEAFNMSQTSKIYAANGTEIAELGTEKREIITYDKMNEVIVDSLVATEDSRFFQHNGFDAPRFLIASIKQILLRDEDAGGASTLTMQVAKNHYQQDKAKVTKGFAGIVRKFTDIYMAVFKVERNYSKEEIIEFYLNDHFLGNNAYGVEQAARTYFSKNAKDLNLSEGSLIMGLYQSPSAYNPILHPDKAEERRADVLYLMERHGYITREERELANAIPVSKLLKPQTSQQAYYSYIVTVIEEAKAKYGVNPNTSSVLVYTNMDIHHQTVMDNALTGKSYKWANPEAQAGLSVVDVKNGKVVAIAAGRNQDGGLNFNYATMTKRQIGSSAKPLFDYGPGIEFENWSTVKMLKDEPYKYSSGQPIRNSDRGYKGLLTLKQALGYSRNVTALKAFQQLDKKKVKTFVESLGITLEKEAQKTGFLHEAYAIGSFNGSNPWEMAAAYAAFANGGIYYEPYTINKIIFRDTGEVITYESEGKRVMSEATAYMITDCLKWAVTGGVSTAAKVAGVNVAAKTGTTNLSQQIIYKYGYRSDSVNDAWVVGYDPDYAIAMWYGYEPLSKKYVTSNSAAFTIRKNLWTATAGKIFKKTGKDFKKPSSVISVTVEKTDNETDELKLAGPYTPDDKKITGLFKKGTEPTEISTKYMRLPTPTNYSVSYEPAHNRINMSWDRVSEPAGIDSSKYGELGYRVYKNSVEIAFTTSNIYSIDNVSDPNGKYEVRASYRNNRTNDSPVATRRFEYTDMSVYDSHLLVSSSKTYKVGDSIDAVDANPSKSDIKVTKSGVDVTSSATVAISITSANGDGQAGIATTEPETYTVTYSITYEKYTKTFKRTVRVVA